MEKDPNYNKKNPFFEKIREYYAKRKKADAQFMDYVQEHKNDVSGIPPLQAPPGEFEKIMAEMEKRRICPRIRWELRMQEFGRRFGKSMRKPVFVGLVAVIIITGTAVGVSAKNAYIFVRRDKTEGKSNIVMNNDPEVVIKEDDVEKAYKEIESQLGVKPLKMFYTPFGMKFEKLLVKHGIATMKYNYEGNSFDFLQANKPVKTSDSMVSDRVTYTEVNNDALGRYITIEKNELPNGNIEYSAGIEIRDSYYYLSGIIEEQDFIDIIENLSY